MNIKTILTRKLWIGILSTGFILLSAFDPISELSLSQKDQSLVLKVNDELQRQAFKILDGKCNVCHRKKNPLMVFSLKNMAKRASKIYKQVFVKRRMPKGNEIQLTSKEYATLEKWLHSQNLY